jgi:peptide/nickel transport system permease protein
MISKTNQLTLPGRTWESDAEHKRRTFLGDAWREFKRNKLAVFGLIAMVLMTLAVLFGPYLYTTDPQYIDMRNASLSPRPGHWFGTDDLGRDGLARILYGGRITIAVGITSMVITIIVGTIVGLLSGFFPKLDNPLMRFTDLMLALPQLPLLLLIIMLFREVLRSMFGPGIGMFVLIVSVIGFFRWMSTARIVRGAVLSVKGKQFVEAAYCIGVKPARILFRHILPNVLSSVIVSSSLTVAQSILDESTLSFLGLGFPSDVPTWGRLIFDGVDYMTYTPWVVIFPGLFISLTLLSINFVGEGLNDALDPRLH